MPDERKKTPTYEDIERELGIQRRQTPAESPHFAHILVTNGERCVAISVLIL